MCLRYTGSIPPELHPLSTFLECTSCIFIHCATFWVAFPGKRSQITLNFLIALHGEGKWDLLPWILTHCATPLDAYGEALQASIHWAFYPSHSREVWQSSWDAFFREVPWMALEEAPHICIHCATPPPLCVELWSRSLNAFPLEKFVKLSSNFHPFTMNTYEATWFSCIPWDCCR